ncbi:MAG: lipopolysaccharide kinase InaA family protein [Planctomycetota bacterium]|jgi:tRNA A-37 threonylcarbamoyl transferase component Bud32
MNVRWTWAESPDEVVRELARRLADHWKPDDAGLIKRGVGRAVWRVPVGDGALLLKHFVVPPGRRLLHVIRPSRAAAEYRAALALSAAGIRTAPAVGYGERRSGGLLREAFYLGRFLQGSVTLGDWMRAAARDGREEAVRAAAEEAMSLVARMHRVPWQHRDLHANNLLRTPDGALAVIDLHSAWRVPRITRAMRLENVARLIFSFREMLDVRIAPDLLAAYQKESGDSDDRWVAEAVAALGAFERDYVRGRTARCTKRSTLFDVNRHANGRLFRRRTYEPGVLDEDLDLHRQALARDGADVLGSAPRTRVTRIRNGTRGRVVKEYLPTGPWGAVRQRLGGGRARSAWTGARRLEVLDIATPEGLALLERPDGSSVLVTCELVDGVSLRTFAEGLEHAAQPGDRADVATQVGWIVGRLSRAGVRHDDLSTKNILLQRVPPAEARDVRDRAPPGAWRASLIDLDNLKPMARHDGLGLVRMLTQLFDVPAWVSRTDRRRFERGFERAAGRPLPPDVARAALAGAEARACRRRAQSRPRPTGAARLGDPHASTSGVTE